MQRRCWPWKKTGTALLAQSSAGCVPIGSSRGRCSRPPSRLRRRSVISCPSAVRVRPRHHRSSFARACCSAGRRTAGYTDGRRGPRLRRRLSSDAEGLCTCAIIVPDDPPGVISALYRQAAHLLDARRRIRAVPPGCCEPWPAGACRDGCGLAVGARCRSGGSTGFVYRSIVRVVRRSLGPWRRWTAMNGCRCSATGCSRGGIPKPPSEPSWLPTPARRPRSEGTLESL